MNTPPGKAGEDRHDNDSSFAAGSRHRDAIRGDYRRKKRFLNGKWASDRSGDTSIPSGGTRPRSPARQRKTSVGRRGSAHIHGFLGRPLRGLFAQPDPTHAVDGHAAIGWRLLISTKPLSRALKVNSPSSSARDAERIHSPPMRPAIASASVFDSEAPLRTRPGVVVAEPRRAAKRRNSWHQGT